jgi:transcriptional regulator with XRE-family HTH domain
LTGETLLEARKRKGWEQEFAAAKLGVSQSYLSLLERGERRVSAALQRKAARVYGLSATALPVTVRQDKALAVDDEDEFACDLGALGYPGFAYMRGGRKRNPVELLASALCTADLDARLVEALPWIVYRFPDLDWDWLTAVAKLNDFQNRLGYIVNLARRMAERAGEADKAASLAERERRLKRSRLMREDTLCHGSMTEAEKNWMRKYRPKAARQWRLLTNLSPEHLHYVNDQNP